MCTGSLKIPFFYVDYLNKLSNSDANFNPLRGCAMSFSMSRCSVLQFGSRLQRVCGFLSQIKKWTRQRLCLGDTL